MKGPFGLVIAAGLALLIVALYFSLAPAIGGSVDNGNPIIGDTVTLSLKNLTNVSTGHRNIGNVQVYNNTLMTSDYRLYGAGDDYTYDSASGTITLTASSAGGKVGNINFNGTYYASMDYSNWASSVNSDMQEGGDWFANNSVWVTLCFLGIVAGIIIAMFMRW